MTTAAAGESPENGDVHPVENGTSVTTPMMNGHVQSKRGRAPLDSHAQTCESKILVVHKGQGCSES